MLMSHPALVVIDVQQALCEGSSAPWDCAGVIDRLNAVASAARTAGVPVIWVQHEEAGLEHGSAGWQLAQRLVTAPSDWRSHKKTGDALWQTDLPALLQAHGINQLILGGMHTEYCVDVTTRAALRHGYPVLLLEDAHTSSGNAALTAPQVIAHHNITLSSTSSFGARAQCVTAHAMVEQLQQRALMQVVALR